MAKVSADGATVEAGEGLERTAGGRGRTEGEARTEGGEIAGAIAAAVAAAFGESEAAGIGVARTVGAVGAVGFGVVPSGGTNAGVAATMAGVATVVDMLGERGFTNVFEGASDGGATSAFIFARARSAAARSGSAAQLFSTVVWAIVSLIDWGRSTPWTLLIEGADITRTSPRTVGNAVVSELA